MKVEKNQSDMTKYPHIINWIHKGFVEITHEAGGDIMARAISTTGVVWEGSQYQDADEAMQALDFAISKIAA